MIYSDDHGETWALGSTPALPESAGMMSESQVIKLPDGRLMLFRCFMHKSPDIEVFHWR